MAKKSRTPPPPRRVQAPKRREDTPDERRTKLVLFGVAGLGIVGLVAAISLFAFGGGGGDGGGSARDALEAAGCRLQVVDSLASANHVQTAPARSAYNTWPPTSGPHNPTPPPWDVYIEPVEQYRLVHNLEHGGIVIQYGDDVPQATVDRIVEWYRDDPNGIIVAPFPELGETIVLEAWTAPESSDGSAEGGQSFLARCPTFDEDAFESFKDTYGFRGPERFPRTLLTPGS